MKDYRQIPIAGAYSPINKLDLGLVLKIDEEELYKPITSQLGPVALSILLLIIIGILLSILAGKTVSAKIDQI